MPPLDNPRHERFAQELAKGKSADESYTSAGYKANRGNASTLKANQNVIDRVAEILDRGAVRAEITVESLIAEAEEVRAKALSTGQLSAALQAIREKGVLSDVRIERGEKGAPGEFAGVDSAASLKEAIAARLGVGAGTSGKTH